MVLACQSKLLNHLSSEIILLTLQVKFVFHLPRWWSVYWWWFYKCHSFIAFHESFVKCLLFYYLKTAHSTISAVAQTVIPHSFFCEGHIRQMVNSRAVLIPHFTMLPLAFDLTKDVLVSRSLAASVPLSSAKHKFMAHLCTGWGFLLLQQGGITTVLFCSLKCGVTAIESKLSPFSHWPGMVTTIINDLQVRFGPNPVCSFCSAV